MPPTRHSNSSAHKDSNQIPPNQNYTLGDYSFRIERSSVPGSSNDKIEAICTDKDGKNARKSIQVPSSTQIDGWYVEANETEATVYARVVEAASSLVTGDLNYMDVEPGAVVHTSINQRIYIEAKGTAYKLTHVGKTAIGATSTPATYLQTFWVGSTGVSYPTDQFTYNGKTVYYVSQSPPNNISENTAYSAGSPPKSVVTPTNSAYVAWSMVYGSDDPIESEKIIGRFQIEIKDAGGNGPDSDWDDPEDYDPDWEPDDPTHTLYVTVTGALSGRHNDPIEDPSYSYIPADKGTVKDYGCGGDGGHGGGGGAGASTVVIHKFATNQANSKEMTAIARRHGYGSGGGKGGKGGDGCILVYY